jgi:protoporphyrinogen oxidase
MLFNVLLFIMHVEREQTALIIGAGPAGLTAAHELLVRTDIGPVIHEATRDIGGLSRTVAYKGNRLDIGGHRFFTKSKRVLDFWESFNSQDTGKGRGSMQMLLKDRCSRIYQGGKFFDYPISLDVKLLKTLGAWRASRILGSYLLAKASPRKGASLETFFINRFGKELYGTFFKDYSEKVWGMPCSSIDSKWGAQRIKGVSLLAVLIDSAAIKKKGIMQEGTETSFIRRFMFPKRGAGAFWEDVAKSVVKRGAKLQLGSRVIELKHDGHKIIEATLQDQYRRVSKVKASHFLSSMPLKDLVGCMSPKIPADVLEIGQELMYRNHIIVGILLRRLKLPDSEEGSQFKDQWIYLQDKNVKAVRVQILNNWSSDMVRKPDETVWIGVEYICGEEGMWRWNSKKMIGLCITEMSRIRLLDPKDVLDSTLVRSQKAYPVYAGAFKELGKLRRYLDRFENLYMIGRNALHTYNNMDHSMLTAMAAVDNIATGRKDRGNIWSVNAEEDYHEETPKAATAGKSD